MKRFWIRLMLLLVVVFMQTGCCWSTCPSGNSAVQWHTPSAGRPRFFRIGSRRTDTERIGKINSLHAATPAAPSPVPPTGRHALPTPPPVRSAPSGSPTRSAPEPDVERPARPGHAAQEVRGEGHQGSNGMTHATRWATVWAMHGAAHDGQNPCRLQLKGSSISCLQVSHPIFREARSGGRDVTLQIVVKFTLHIGGQAFGSGIGIERGEKGLKMFRGSLYRVPCGSDHVVRRWQQQAP